MVDNFSLQDVVLDARGLTKSYESMAALRGLTFHLEAGHILGFLGPNGAGKTTAIRILTTILEPDAGNFFVAGISSEFPQRIRSRIGVLPESLGFPKNHTAVEHLTYYGQLYGRNKQDAISIANKLLEEVGLKARSKSLIGTYSRGMRQRLGIARSLINDPVVVFLDEPTLGLDPRGQQELLTLVEQIARERNAGVILCSHLLAEVESVCDDVVILRNGQVVAAGPVTDILGKANRNVIRLHVPSSKLEETRMKLENLPYILQATPSNRITGWLNIKLGNLSDGNALDENQIKNGILETLIRADIPILSFEAEGARLQDVFLELTEESL